MMFENTKPVRKSTLSSRTYFSAIWRPTSGLNWSSPTSTSAGRAPSLPPFIFTASWKPSRMSTPSAAGGKVVQHVLRLTGAGDGAGHRGMRRDPLQEKLRPAGDAELRRQRRQRFSLDAPEERAFGEGPVHD